MFICVNMRFSTVEFFILCAVDVKTGKRIVYFNVFTLNNTISLADFVVLIPK